MNEPTPTPSVVKYDLTAHLYSFITGALFILGGATESILRKKAYTETLQLKGNEKILDICCANGKGTRILSKLVPKGSIYGIDLNPGMIAFANSKNTEEYQNTDFRIGDCAKIPFNDRTFDVVTATLALHELPTSLLKSVMNEIKRVLKPNGYLFVFDFRYPKNPTTYLRIMYYFMRIFEDESAARFMMVDQTQLFAKHGFKKILQNNYISKFMPATLYQLK
ncbi:MAG: class I SAM-dependent methyltransferase [Candidatus Heimdallarchaeota archaeon]